jgi:glyoxylase-like metal-dependent hydrolase (beta-lactamase superfamily II)
MDPLAKQVNNIYVIDTNFAGRHDHYMSAYLVKGDKLALIDAGQPPQLEVVRAEIRAHGFSVSDIDYIFVTHCEHPDHAGNVAPLLQEAPKAVALINPVGMEALTAPDKVDWSKKVAPEFLSQQMSVVRGWQPVPPSRIRSLKDGETIDLGDGEKLTVKFTHAHQPSGLVLFEEKNHGLFIGDAIGNCFMDANSHYLLSPDKSDPIEALRVLYELNKMPWNYLYMGHYGITDQPHRILSRTITKLHLLLDMGKEYISKGQPEKIAEAYFEMMIPEVENLKLFRDEVIYRYARKHIGHQGKLFARYSQNTFGSPSAK